MKICKAFKNYWKQFSLYIHGFWLPWLEQARTEGRIKHGEKKIKIGNIEYDYKGEIDEFGNACGKGIATRVNIFTTRCTGTWYNNKPHGINIRVHFLTGQNEAESADRFE